MRPQIGNRELENVSNAVKSGWISSRGSYVGEFETKFANYVGTRHGAAVSNGTTALHLALTALGITKDDEVILPSLTYISCANAISYTGAKPVFVDADLRYWCLNPTQIEDQITESTRAILVVHLYGHPCDMTPILEIARKHGLLVIEDCAEAHGAEYKGKKVGGFGDIGCFSFYGNKIITTGEGGMCLTDNDQVAEKMMLLRDHGMNRTKRYWHDIIGFNYRMTNLQAAIGVAQLEKIDRIIADKITIAKTYNKHLEGIENLVCMPEMPWAKNVRWLYSILVEENIRDRLISQLEQQGIEVRPFFYPIHTLPPYKQARSQPVAEQLSRRGLNLPSGPILTEAEIYEIVSIIRQVLR